MLIGGEDLKNGKLLGLFLGGEEYCRKAMKINQSVQRGRPSDLGHC